MSQQDQQRQRQQEKQRQREDSRQGSASQQRTTDQTTTQVLAGAKQKKSDMKLEAAKVTEGKDGARNLRVQWIYVDLPNARSCRFAITTAAGNSVEAVMEQKTYRRTHQGTSSLQTEIVPLAPMGTTGKLTVRDLASGETLEQPWIWPFIGGDAGAWLWQLIKRLFSSGS